ncbi:MAG: hypothetical protein OXH20_01850 [bacterium]|nr:hypothetical protein [bacterium]MXZ31374.1 hypothetical protein [Acidimicrobiia bacterium]
MRRALRRAAAPDRVSLSLPSEPASVSLARTAAAGLLAHRDGDGALGAHLASVVADLLSGALAQARARDRLIVRFDLGRDSVLTTVAIDRAGRWRGRGSFLASRAMSLKAHGG